LLLLCCLPPGAAEDVWLPQGRAAEGKGVLLLCETLLLLLLLLLLCCLPPGAAEDVWLPQGRAAVGKGVLL
jgi:hypothetical protein